VLDEPTNDLDLETLDLLEEVIADYEGTALIVSHDRDFLDRVATTIVAAEGGGRFAEYAGGYSDMLAQRAPKVEPARPKAAKKQAVERPGKQRPVKMNFSDSHALKTLPEKIAAAEIEISKLEHQLADAGLYARDPAGFAELSGRLAGLKAQKDADEERWLALEMLREAMDG
jgi:ATP-binding cassette subfamily F protein uup